MGRILLFRLAGTQGEIRFDALQGRFRYTAAPEDVSPFWVRFSWSGGPILPLTDTQVVPFQPMRILPAEEQVMGVPPIHPEPDPESTDYIVRSKILSAGTEEFNGATRTTRSVTISGKTVVFQNGHPNNLYDYNENPDIREITIYAETLIIRSPLHLPQTTVTIYSKELRFEDTAGTRLDQHDATEHRLPTRRITEWNRRFESWRRYIVYQHPRC